MGYGEWVAKGLLATNPIGWGVLAGDELLNDGDMTKGIGEALDDVTGDITGANDNFDTETNANASYGTPEIYWGGYPEDAWNYSQRGLGQMDLFNQGAGFGLKEAQRYRGPQAYENQALSDREAFTRGFHQDGALQLASEAAMGMAPSEAAYLMQSGLDRSLANQQAMMGSARGSAAVALAGGNAAANSAAMQNQAYTQAGAMRAQEMANARGLYGGLSGQMREQDLQRLGQGNQMAQFNAGLNDQYRIGMGGVGAQYGNTGLGYYQAAQQPLNQQMQGDISAAQMGSDNYNRAMELKHGIVQGNIANKRADRDQMLRTAGTAMELGGKIATAGAA